MRTASGPADVEVCRGRTVTGIDDALRAAEMLKDLFEHGGQLVVNRDILRIRHSFGREETLMTIFCF